ncbi:MAG: integrase, partial [Phycisphaeraceae bacterium]|nr:integrase [Phycisphaeraceae bacterium]
MASLYSESNGNWIIQLSHGSRPKIRLGKTSKRAAERAHDHIEHLISAKKLGHHPHNETVHWIASLDDELHGRLAVLGLIQAREQTQLKPFIESYIQSRIDVKPSTAEVYQHVLRNLLAHFGGDRALQTITVGDAEDFRLYLIGQGLSENTVRRRCGIAKQFMENAVKRELIQRNPFTMKVTVRSNEKRKCFISRDDAMKVLAACPNNQWRLMFALCRFAGLRCTSELVGLRWDEVNWKQGWFLVHSPKTEHHDGKDTRRVPIFPDLYPHLLEASKLRSPSEDYIVTYLRDPKKNPRTHMMRIIKKAGLKPWPKLFHNLRSSCQTELSLIRPGYQVCAWLGNSEEVAKEHYLQMRDEDYTKAAYGDNAVQNPVQQGAVEGCKPMQGKTGQKNKPGVCSQLQINA